MSKRAPQTITLAAKPKDHALINALKSRLGMASTSDLIRFALNELAISKGIRAA